MNGIPSSLGVFIFAVVAFVLFTLIPLVKYLVKRQNKQKEENNAR